VLVPYFCYGASTITAVALVFFEKNTLALTPAAAAEVAFWLGLPWSMKMVAGVASDAWPILGSRRGAYMLIGCAATLAGDLALAMLVQSTSTYLLASVLIAVGYMIQDVVADALSVEVARDEREIAQIQTWGRIALLSGGIAVSYLGGVLAERIGVRATFALAGILPLLAAVSMAFIPRREPVKVRPPVGPGGRRNKLILAGGLGYAFLGIALRATAVPFAEEIVLVVSAVVIALLLRGIGLSRAILIAAVAIFVFRAAPLVGQGYSYWAIDRLGFDERFLGLLGQISAVLSVVGLLLFKKTISTKPVSFTLFWVTIAGAVLYLPSIGLFYGVHEWFGVSARTFAVIDTTISAPLAQLAMVPMLILIARSAQPGSEATTFAVLASLMNLALSASQLFTSYLNDAFGVTQANYSGLGRLMIVVGVIGLVPLVLLPMLRRSERETGPVVRTWGAPSAPQAPPPTGGREVRPPAGAP
jgi:MFS family permease